jgi:hypothetical protein
LLHASGKKRALLLGRSLWSKAGLVVRHSEKDNNIELVGFVMARAAENGPIYHHDRCIPGFSTPEEKLRVLCAKSVFLVADKPEGKAKQDRDLVLIARFSTFVNFALALLS